MNEDATRPEHVTHYYVEIKDDSSTEDVHHSQLQESANIPPIDISEFLRLLQHVQRPPPGRSNPLVNYSKSHILTSDQHCETMDFKAARKVDAMEGTKNKKRRCDAYKGEKIV